MEIWKEIKNFETLYEVSNTGNVRRKNKNKNRKLCVNSRGYYLVVLSKEGKPHSYNVHRLVAEAFIEKPFNKNFVNHIDGIKTNNNVNNLEWVTHQENVRHAIETGLNKSYFRKGDKHTNSKLNDSLVLQIYDLSYHRVYPQHKIADMYGISQHLVSLIKNKMIWNHIH